MPRLKYLGRQTSNFVAAGTVDLFLKNVAGASWIIIKAWGGSADADPATFVVLPSWDGINAFGAGAAALGIFSVSLAAQGALNATEGQGMAFMINGDPIGGLVADGIPWACLRARFTCHASITSNNVKLDAWAIFPSNDLPTGEMMVT